MTVVILDRPRHYELIKAVRQAGARIKLIMDGDVSPAVATAFEDSGVDVMMVIGGAPEGVLAAAALRCVGGEMQGRLWPEDGGDIARAQAMGILDVNKLLTMDDLVKGEDVIFAATGITDGELLRGVRYLSDRQKLTRWLCAAEPKLIRFIEAIHCFDKKPNYIGIKRSY